MPWHRVMTHVVIAILTAQLVACATPHGRIVTRRYELERDLALRVANLERGAQYPWVDKGECVVREASQEWKVLVERCYHALVLSRIRFQDTEHHCPVASVDAASVARIVGV